MHQLSKSGEGLGHVLGLLELGFSKRETLVGRSRQQRETAIGQSAFSGGFGIRRIRPRHLMGIVCGAQRLCQREPQRLTHGRDGAVDRRGIDQFATARHFGRNLVDRRRIQDQRLEGRVQRRVSQRVAKRGGPGFRYVAATHDGKGDVQTNGAACLGPVERVGVVGQQDEQVLDRTRRVQRDWGRKAAQQRRHGLRGQAGEAENLFCLL